MIGGLSSRLTSLARYLSRPTPAVHPLPQPRPPPSSSPPPPPPPPPPRRSSLASLLSYLPSLSFLPRLDALTHPADDALHAPSPYDSLPASVERRTRTLGADEAAYIALRRTHVLPHPPAAPPYPRVRSPPRVRRPDGGRVSVGWRVPGYARLPRCSLHPRLPRRPPRLHLRQWPVGLHLGHVAALLGARGRHSRQRRTRQGWTSLH